MASSSLRWRSIGQMLNHCKAGLKVHMLLLIHVENTTEAKFWRHSRHRIPIFGLKKNGPEMVLPFSSWCAMTFLQLWVLYHLPISTQLRTLLVCFVDTCIVHSNVDFSVLYYCLLLVHEHGGNTCSGALTANFTCNGFCNMEAPEMSLSNFVI